MPKSRAKSSRRVSATSRKTKDTKLQETSQKLERFITDGKAGDATHELEGIRDELKNLA